MVLSAVVRLCTRCLQRVAGLQRLALVQVFPAVIHGVTKRGPRVSSMTQRVTCSALSFCSGHIDTVTLRFSPRFSFSPLSCALARVQ